MTADPQRYIAENLLPEERALKLDSYERFIAQIQLEAERKFEFLTLLQKERDRFIAVCQELEAEGK